MTLLSSADILDWVETDLPDSVLQIMLDDAEAEIVKRYGAHGEASSAITEDHYPDRPLYGPGWNPLPGDAFSSAGRRPCIYPARPVGSVTSITEREDGSDTILAANDYRLIYGGLAIERLDTGTHVRSNWAPEVRIVYQATSELATRKRVQADLVKLAIQYKGLISEQTGDYNSSMDVYQTERNRILAALETGRLFV